MKKQQSKRVIPGFGLTMGVTLAMLSIVVLIPLASLAVYSARLGFREFIEVITRPRVLSGFYVSFITAFAATVINAIMGLGEYGSVVFIAGNKPYYTEITPLIIMSKLQEFDYESATAIALVTLAVSFLILFGVNLVQARNTKRIRGRDA